MGEKPLTYPYALSIVSNRGGEERRGEEIPINPQECKNPHKAKLSWIAYHLQSH